MTPDAEPLVVALEGTVAEDRELLGGKAAGLVRMGALGLAVPPAFTLTTAAFRRFRHDGGRLADDVWDQVLDRLRGLERLSGRHFGGRPALLVSVRSGAPVSMPGMMDTVLNVGLTDRAAAELRDAIIRVFESWDSDRARRYRTSQGIAEDLGTAVTVQAMVFGDRDERSGTGVLITRNPVTGADEPYGEWLPRAQGEDLVSGRRSPLPLAALADQLPEAHRDLLSQGHRLERAERYPVEIEFTVESERLYLLQVRRSTRSTVAAVRWAADLVDEGVADAAEAMDRGDEQPERAAADAEPATEPAGVVLARGNGVVPGRRRALAVADPDEVERLAEAGVPAILVRPHTSPHDIHGFLAASAVVTEHGGGTSHAAVVARQIGLPCVVGCGEGAVAAIAGRVVTVDGSHGLVWEE